MLAAEARLVKANAIRDELLGFEHGLFARDALRRGDGRPPRLRGRLLLGERALDFAVHGHRASRVEIWRADAVFSEFPFDGFEFQRPKFEAGSIGFRNRDELIFLIDTSINAESKKVVILRARFSN